MGRKTKTLLATLAIASQLAGCATLMAGGPDLVPVATNPPGAQVVLNGQSATRRR